MVQYLSRLGVACAVSPLHVPDNEVKKEHYHVLISFDGVKSVESLENLIDVETNQLYDFRPICNCWGISKNDFPHFIIINGIAGYYRYLVHKDNEDKQQFNYIEKRGYIGLVDEDKYNSIVLLNCFDSKDYLTRDKKISEDIQLIQIIKENNINTESDLMYYLAQNNNIGLINYIKNNIIL